ncbi:hypothetical protein GCM10010252_72790 [Streptomyces aureoverticillatus]|nr:hypothetical protein GCM10010252_72790 [Streptomyces aureoverticillatus]
MRQDPAAERCDRDALVVPEGLAEAGERRGQPAVEVTGPRCQRSIGGEEFDVLPHLVLGGEEDGLHRLGQAQGDSLRREEIREVALRRDQFGQVPGGPRQIRSHTPTPPSAEEARHSRPGASGYSVRHCSRFEADPRPTTPTAMPGATP